MTENQKSVWIDALRSDEYEQRTGHLHIDGGHCCLGVAENVLCLKGQTHSSCFLGEEFLPREIQVCLSRMNDSGVTFDVIAGFIEEKIEPTE